MLKTDRSLLLILFLTVFSFSLADAPTAVTPVPVYAAVKEIAQSEMDRFFSPSSLEEPVLSMDCARLLRTGSFDDKYLSAVEFVEFSDSIPKALLYLASGSPLYGHVRYTECAEVPMLQEGQQISLNSNYNLHGYITSDDPITSVSITITHSEPRGTLYPVNATLIFKPEDNIRCYDLNKAPQGQKKGLNGLINPAGYRAGIQTLTLAATTLHHPDSVELLHVTYEVVFDRWLKLRQDCFSDNYSKVVDFFGEDTSNYLFTYKWRGGGSRKIVIDDDWRTNNLVTDEWGRVHKKAVPYFEKARSYMKTSYFRVHGTDLRGKERDSNVLPLTDLFMKNDGTCITRFTQSQKYISHHTLGTVIDVNTNLSVNSQWVRNKPIIYNAVKNHLIYNGIKTAENGIRYYDYTFDGDYKNAVKDVPPACVNYLLYELAFYRAGFRWGFYFDTSDAMHFTLTESDPSLFENGPYALRKVFEYAN